MVEATKQESRSKRVIVAQSEISLRGVPYAKARKKASNTCLSLSRHLRESGGDGMVHVGGGGL